MSTKTKIIIGGLFLVQIGIITWSKFDFESNKSPFELQLDLYLQDAKNVRTLDLQGFDLNSLPVSILEFQNVVDINLSNNQFDKVPAILYELPHLEQLNMSHNQLKDISLRKFKTLTQLNFSHNKLEYINGQTYLENLENLNLSHNQLSAFPTLRIPMDTINMSNNGLFNIQDIASKLSKTVQHLDLSNNQIRYFDDVRLILNNCYSLDLSNNVTSDSKDPTIFPTFFYTEYLNEKLFLNGCYFKKFDEIPASRLEVLEIGKNGFILKGNDLNNLTTLEKLNLRATDLRNFKYFNIYLTELNLIDVLVKGELNLILPNLEILHLSVTVDNVDLPDFPNLKMIHYHSVSDRFIKRLEIKYPNANIIHHTSNN